MTDLEAVALVLRYGHILRPDPETGQRFGPEELREKVEAAATRVGEIANQAVWPPLGKPGSEIERCWKGLIRAERWAL